MVKVHLPEEALLLLRKFVAIGLIENTMSEEQHYISNDCMEACTLLSNSSFPFRNAVSIKSDTVKIL